jgi:hypothetical protein
VDERGDTKMGMGYGANYVDVVEESFIEEIVGKNLIEECRKLLAVADISAFIRYFDYGDESDNAPELINVYENIICKFNKITGLDVGLGYHDKNEDGDRYDDVNGWYWWVEGVYQLTPIGEKYKDKIERKFFVTFG